MPHKANQVAVISSEKGSIVDIKSKKHVRSIPKWGGHITKDGKCGLYAPTRYVPQKIKGVCQLKWNLNAKPKGMKYIFNNDEQSTFFGTPYIDTS